jgi:predicted phage terminase large subunit-like protein
VKLIEFAQLARPGWKWDRYHELIFDLMERCTTDPAEPSLLLSTPPGAAKTECMIILAAWLVAHAPLREHVISLSNAANLAQLACTNAQRILMLPQVAERFPLEFDKATQSEFTVAGGDGRPAMYSAPLGGSVTGARARVLLFDDLVKNLEVAFSETQLESIWAEFNAVAETRLLPGGKIVGIGTRWSLKDVHERLLTRAKNPSGRQFYYLNLAATNDGTQSWLLDTRTGERTYIEPYDTLAKVPGQPYSFTATDYEGKRADLGNALYETLYQGNPTSSLDAMFPVDCWTELEDGLNTSQIAYAITAWDMSTGKASDFSANVTILLMTDGSVRIEDAWRGKPTFADLPGIVMHRWTMLGKRYNCVPLLVIEDSSAGTQVLQIMQTSFPVVPVLAAKAVKSKQIRALGVTPLTRSGRVGIARSASWRSWFVSELAQFPAGANDDAADALIHALKALTSKDEFHRPEFLLTPGSLQRPTENQLVDAIMTDIQNGEYASPGAIDPELDRADNITSYERPAFSSWWDERLRRR